MSKYPKKAQEKVEKVMHEFKHGKAKNIKSRKQAITVGLSEARQEGAKVPDKKK